jgi:hypothetical protein
MSSTPDPTTESANRPGLPFFIEDSILTPMRFAGDSLDQIEALFAAMQAIADSPKEAIAAARINKLYKLADIGRFLATTHADFLLSATETLQQEHSTLLRALAPNRNQ